MSAQCNLLRRVAVYIVIQECMDLWGNLVALDKVIRALIFYIVTVSHTLG